MELSIDASLLKYSGSLITTKLFGANILFDRDRVAEHPNSTLRPTYDDAVRELSIENIRYPGGSITEDLFDIENPNASIQNGQDVMGLSDFISFLSTNRSSGTIVIPTARYLSVTRDEAGHRYQAVKADAIDKFVRNLLSDAHSKGVPLTAIELGNEWWGSGMSATEYGRVASKMATLVQDSINRFKGSENLPTNWQEPDILIQVGHGENAEQETRQIFDQFDRHGEYGAIDGLVTHRYLSGDFSNIGSSGVWRPYYGQFDVWKDLAFIAGLDTNLANYVTEWNVKANNSGETGLKAASALISLFTELLDAGVEQANIWAVQQNNPQNLTISTGLPGSEWDGLSLSGEMFRLMRTSLIGKKEMSSQQIENISGHISVNIFGKNSERTIFLSDRSGEGVDLTLRPDQILRGFDYGWIKILGVGGSDPLDADARPDVQLFMISDVVGARGNLTLNLDPWETAVINLTVASSGVDLFAPRQGSKMQGTQFGDKLQGGDGLDQILGRSGADLMIGGGRKDVLRGENGSDTLYGGGGADLVSGGPGGDVLSGGSGPDAFVFGASRARDIVTDFNEDMDILRFKCAPNDFDDLRLLNVERGTVVLSDETSVLLIGVEARDLDAGNFQFFL